MLLLLPGMRAYTDGMIVTNVCRLNLELFKARDVMHRPVITITPHESLAHLAKLILETVHGGFPVVKFYEKTRHDVAYGLITRLLMKSETICDIRHAV
jgi:CBS domain-containing protein